jgi:fatty-acyl-CoA synthase
MRLSLHSDSVPPWAPDIAAAAMQGAPSSPAPMALASGPEAQAVKDTTLGDLLAWAAITAPDRTALVAVHTLHSADAHADAASVLSTPAREWTYAELYTQALRVAHALQLRFKPGERLAVWAPNLPEWVMLEFGAAMAGLVLVAIPLSASAGEVERAIKDTGAAGAFVCASHEGRAMLATVQALAPRCRALREVVRLDRWAQFVATGDETTPNLPAVHHDDATLITFSAGVTAPAKPLRLSHRSLVNGAAHVAERLGVQDGDTWIATLPLEHAAGCGLTVLGAVAKRATLVLSESREPAHVLALMSRYAGDKDMVLMDGPALLSALIAHERPRSIANLVAPAWPSLRAVCCVGANAPPALFERYFGRTALSFHSLYGQAETGWASLMTPPCDASSHSTPLGTPLPGVQVCIVDPLTAQTLSVGEVGEICTRNDTAKSAQDGLPTAAPAGEGVDAQAWLHTGDLGQMDEQGQVHFVCRLSHTLLHGGQRVHGQLLEALLRRHPDVADVVVIPLPRQAGAVAKPEPADEVVDDDAAAQWLGAFVLPLGEAALNKATLQAHLQRQGAARLAPGAWFVLSRFPTNGLGQTQAWRLREHFMQGELVAL